MAAPNDLQALFANLKPRSSASQGSQNQIFTSANRSASSMSLNAQPAHGLSSVNASYNRSTNSPLTSHNGPQQQHTTGEGGSAPGGGTSDRAQNLLSLLKFSQPAGGQSPHLSRTASDNMATSQIDTGHAQGRGIPASDLVANFIRSSESPTIRGGGPEQFLPPTSAIEEAKGSPAGNTAGNHQEALMRLLKRSSESEQSRTKEDFQPRPGVENVQRSSSRNVSSPIRMFGTSESREHTPFEPPMPANAPQGENKPVFNYMNPFEALAAASRQHTPQPAANQSFSPAPETKIAEELGDSRLPADIPKESIEMPEDAAPIKQEIASDIKALAEELEDHPVEAAKEVKEELDKPENEGALEEELPKPVAKAVKQVINDAAEESPDKWESVGSAEDSPADVERIVPVYNFPIKPFVSITITEMKLSKVLFREDGSIPIAKFKKAFDQLDRTLATATSKYIAYCQPKGSGIRIIRQDDGADRKLFKHTKDRIFSLSFCSTTLNGTATEVQALIGSGVSGATYYATVSNDGHNLFDQDELDTESLIFPPYPKGDENTSGGMLKTRARKSSRHPDFFGIGRGKSIHIVWPSTAMSHKYGVAGKNREVDVEKYFNDRPLKITTGKAGKDFTFSGDDTLIVSLDKVGRLRFWDIRALIREENATATRVQPVDIRTPLLTLSTANPAEKTWPTSVLFVDKLRPYVKNTALRYVLVGLKQNHTLQLWDILLGKAVQELSFPHDSETDAICSVAYHPHTGIIVVGHPTRNSVYFVHLSAPRYNLPGMSQAQLIENVVLKADTLPKPESTACMSGIRELSFANRGQMRCVDLLPTNGDAASEKSDDPTRVLFELYVTHADGVLCLPIIKADLGWNIDSKVVHPIKALENKIIALKDLKLGGVIEEASEVNGESRVPTPPVVKTPKKKSKQQRPEPAVPEPSAATVLEPIFNNRPRDRSHSPAPARPAANIAKPAEVPAQPSEAGVAETKTSKKKKKSQTPASPKAPAASQAKIIASDPIAEEMPSQDHTREAQNITQPSIPITSKSNETVNIGISGDWLDKELKKIEAMFKTVLDDQMRNLYHNTHQDRIVQDEASQARQDAILRVISTTLTSNVEQSLSRMISANMQNSVVPSVTNLLTGSLGSRITEQMASTFHTLIPHQLNTQLTAAVQSAMQSPGVISQITNQVSSRIASQVENEFTEILHNTITPTFKQLAIHNAQSVADEVERRASEQLKIYQEESRAQQTRMDKILETMQGMTETLTLMSGSQVEFQAKILEDRARQHHHSHQQPRNDGHTAAIGSRPVSRNIAAATPTRATFEAPTPAPVATPVTTTSIPTEDYETQTVSILLHEQRYEEASIKWLQSAHPQEIFDKLFIHINAEFLTSQVSPLVTFSIGITVAGALQNNTKERLEWLKMSLGCIDPFVSPPNFPTTRIFNLKPANIMREKDPELRELSAHAPSLMDQVILKLETLYTRTVNSKPNDLTVRIIPQVLRKAREVRAAFVPAQAQAQAGAQERGQGMAMGLSGGSRRESRQGSGYFGA
ncbi:MAG: hypothetical protein Q9160_007149 [Pyrenula sp. 1 TL-2023]